MFFRRTAWTCLWLVSALRNAHSQVTTCTAADISAADISQTECFPSQEDIAAGCSTSTDVGICAQTPSDEFACAIFPTATEGNICDVPAGCLCSLGICFSSDMFDLCEFTPVCPDGTDMCDDPHMKGLRGQKIDWSGIDGGWYSMIRDDDAHLQVNLRLTAPLSEEFPDRQLITGLSVLSEGHSLVIDVTNPYDSHTKGCPHGTSPCLADGGLRAVVDGVEVEGLLRSARNEDVADGIILSASNLPAECRQFGGDKIWARMYDEMLQGKRQLAAEEEFEDWILRFDDMAAPGWCKNYIEQHDLADLQSTHAVFKIVTPTVTVRLNVGTNGLE